MPRTTLTPLADPLEPINRRRPGLLIAASGGSRPTRETPQEGAEPSPRQVGPQGRRGGPSAAAYHKGPGLLPTRLADSPKPGAPGGATAPTAREGRPEPQTKKEQKNIKITDINFIDKTTSVESARIADMKNSTTQDHLTAASSLPQIRAPSILVRRRTDAPKKILYELGTFRGDLRSRGGRVAIAHAGYQESSVS